VKKLIFLSLFLVACGKQTPVSVNTYGTDTGAGSAGIHTVLAGDTVYEVARNYQLPIREIITLNKIQAPYRLNVGYRMKLPPPNNYRVRAGDSVTGIARLYEVSPSQIVKLNGLQPPYRLNVGQVIRLPSLLGNTPPQPATSSTASVPRVEREGVGNAPRPNAKPRAQTASTTQRARIPRTTPELSGNGQYMRPVDGKIISGFGPKEGGLHNDGVNIRAPRGTPVRAAQNGVVVYAGNDLEGYGNLILVRHQNNKMTAYAHLDKFLINRGETVKQGQSIGTVGSTGQVDSPQLHFEIRRGTKALNPVQYL
jgi:murein DD-endopeptidase MepM/ murein hydrolase activator NlpD